MKNILVLGAGQSTSYLISYFLSHAQEFDWFVTVCDKDAEVAQRQIAGHARGQAIAADINDAPTRGALIAKAQVVINMLTRPFQHLIALECLNTQTHMLSASYEDPQVGRLDADAHRQNVLILNEMGLDPGIDHMIAMSIIQRVRNAGGMVTGFRSYGGGLPAPEVQTNPLRYFVTWNPRNVLMAGEDGAIWKEDGKVKLLPFHQVFQRTWAVEIEGIGSVEAYPNRDSLAYEGELGLTGDETIIRGTLRYPGWSETWQQITYLGLANEIMRIPNLKNLSYREMTEMCLPQGGGRTSLEQQFAGYLGISPTGRIMENLRWLGLFSKQKIGFECSTVADVLIQLIRDKLKMPQGARDMVILRHEITARYPNENHRKEKLTSTLVEYGDPVGFTAMARTVGLPIAIGAQMLLTNRLPLTGCHIPTHPAVYQPVLEELRRLGVAAVETIQHGDQD